MPLWNSQLHPPTPYELTRLRMACKGKSGGSMGEWCWHGGKRRKGERPSLSGTNIGVFFYTLKRNSEALELLGTQGNSQEGIFGFDAHFAFGSVRTPDKLIKVRAGPEAGSPLDILAAECEGKEGDAESEWSITRINGDAHVVFFTSIPAIAGRAIRRNAGAILRWTQHKYGAKEGETPQFGVTLTFKATEIRHPSTLLRPS
jgi:hypothetical protein